MSTEYNEEFFKEKELEILKHLYPNTPITAHTKWDSIDFINYETKEVTEAKFRLFTHDHFMNRFEGRFMIEVSKYNELMDASKTLGFKPLYVFGFMGNNPNELERICVVDLSKIDSIFLCESWKNCPSVTVDSNKGKRIKHVYEIPNWLNNPDTTTTYNIKYSNQ